MPICKSSTHFFFAPRCFVCYPGLPSSSVHKFIFFRPDQNSLLSYLTPPPPTHTHTSFLPLPNLFSPASLLATASRPPGGRRRARLFCGGGGPGQVVKHRPYQWRTAGQLPGGTVVCPVATPGRDRTARDKAGADETVVWCYRGHGQQARGTGARRVVCFGFCCW